MKRTAVDNGARIFKAHLGCESVVITSWWITKPQVPELIWLPSGPLPQSNGAKPAFDAVSARILCCFLRKNTFKNVNRWEYRETATMESTILMNCPGRHIHCGPGNSFRGTHKLLGRVWSSTHFHLLAMRWMIYLASAETLVPHCVLPDTLLFWFSRVLWVRYLDFYILIHSTVGTYESAVKQEVFKLRRRRQAIRESSRQHYCRRYDVSIGVSLSSLLLP